MTESNIQATLSLRALAIFRSAGSFLLIAAVVACGVAGPVEAQEAPDRPPIEQLLPETTAAFFQIDNLQETLPKFLPPQFLEDENVAPFLERMYQEAETAYSQYAQDDVGMTLEQIRDLPAGELCLAIIAPRRKNLEVFVALDIDPDSESVDAAVASVDMWKKRFQPEGLTESVEETEEGVQIYRYEIPESPRDAYAFIRDGWFVSCTSRAELVALLARWEGVADEKVRPLSQNRKFVTIMNRCHDTEDIEPEVRFFVDPISVARGGLRGNAAALAAMNFLPTVGLDGVLGLGGSMSLQSEEFQAVFHGHLLLSNPQAGILEMLALRPGTSDPQAWVPVDVSNYSSTSWDPQQMIAEFEKLIDMISGEGEFEENAVGKIRDRFGLDLREDIVDTLDGKVTYLQWSDPDGEWLLNPACNGVAIGVSDVDKATEVIEAILKTRENKAENDAKDDAKDDAGGSAGPLPQLDHEGAKIWLLGSSAKRKKRQERVQERVGGLPMRMAEPALCLIENSLVICDSVEMIKHLIDVSQGLAESLADDDDFNQCMQSLLQAVDSDVPCAITWSQPAGAFRDLIRLANDDRSKEFLDKFSQDVPVLANLRTALDEQPVPEYEQIERYLRPAGAIVTTDDTGYHFLSFQYRPDEQ